MGVSHKNTTHTTMKTAFLTRSLALLPGCRPPGKRAGRLERDRAYYPAQPGRRSRRDTPISSPKDIAGYRPNGPFLGRSIHVLHPPPPWRRSCESCWRQGLTRLEIKPRASHVAAGDVPARRAPCYQPSQREPGGSRALTDLELKRCARNGRTRWQEQGK